MEKRTLGKNKLEVSAIGFGCMGLNFGALSGERYPAHLAAQTGR